MDSATPQAEDRLLCEKLNPFVSPGRIPLSFQSDGKTIRGIPEDFKPEIKTKKINDDIVLTVVTGTGNGLSIHAECLSYLDFPVTEWMARITNVGKGRSPVLSGLKIGTNIFTGTLPRLRRCSGDNGELTSFEESLEPLSKPVSLFPVGGRPCNGAFPYMRLLFEEYGVSIAIGWPGQWQADFTPADGGVAFSTGQQRMHMSLNPGETIRTPRITLMGFTGGEARGINLWRRWFLKHILIRENGKPLAPKYVLSENGGGEEFTRATGENQLASLHTFMNRGLFPDIWWIDAGWYPCGMNWRNTGTLFPNPEHFPNGLGRIGELCARSGTELLVWFEPERVRAGTELSSDHPDWLLSRDESVLQSDLQFVSHPGMRALLDSKLLNLGDDACCDWLIERISKLIKDSGIRVYRQDFNFNPLPYWIENEAPERVGAIENHYVVNYLRFWDALIEQNPGLWIDSCASGGRRNDLETLRRSVPLHYTDVAYGIHPQKQAQYHVMFQWIPYFKGVALSWDDAGGGYDGEPAHQKADRFAYYAAMCPAVSAIIAPDDDESQYSMTKEMLAIWRRAAELMLSGDFYPLTPCRKSEGDYYAVQFDDPMRERGFLLILRNTRAEDDAFTAQPRLPGGAVFRFENSETGETFTMDGRKASAGIPVAIPKRSGVILFYSVFRAE